METATVNPPLVIQREKITKSYIYLGTKRFIDILVSGCGLIVISPLLLLVSLIIKVTSKGNILFWQPRAGKNGVKILFPKFRSMIDGADQMLEEVKSQNDHHSGHTFKMKDDPRITTIGRFIRKFSIDELPQLWLVLKGDMTLVGPRPATLDEVAEYDEVEKQRLVVKPGLTCIWQVSGRGDLDFYQQLEMDINYINNRSLLMDIKLLIATVPAVITGRGAY